MAMTLEERAKLERILGELDNDERDLVLRNIESFTNWLKDALSSVYVKIKDTINKLFDFLENFFG